MKLIKLLPAVMGFALLAGCVAPLTNKDLIKEFDNTEFTVTETDRGLVVNVPLVFFEFDSADLTLAAREKLGEVSEILTRPSTSSRQLSVEGHSDDVGDEQYNLALSQERADNVLEILAFSGIKRERLEAIGFGETRPVELSAAAGGQDAEQARSRNRRVEIVILNS